MCREISNILTHIESEPATIETSDGLVTRPSFEKRLQAVTEGFPEVVDMHDLMFKRVGGRLYLSLHITMQDDLPLSRVHDIQTAVEGRFRQEVPELFRVLIHPEPIRTIGGRSSGLVVSWHCGWSASS